MICDPLSPKRQVEAGVSAPDRASYTPRAHAGLPCPGRFDTSPAICATTYMRPWAVEKVSGSAALEAETGGVGESERGNCF